VPPSTAAIARMIRSGKLRRYGPKGKSKKAIVRPALRSA
jgi:hypothetical protein